MVHLDAAGGRGDVDPARLVGDDALVLELAGERAVGGERVDLRAELVRARDDAQAAVLLGRLVDVDGDSDQVVVRVREERIVLVPLEASLVAGGRLQVELRVVELDVRPDERLDRVEDALVVETRSMNAWWCAIGLKIRRTWRSPVAERVNENLSVAITSTRAGCVGLGEELVQRRRRTATSERSKHLGERQVAQLVVARLLVGGRHRPVS